MQSKYFFLLFLFNASIYSQNDLCSNATILTPNTTCTATYGGFVGTTLDGNTSECAPNASQDVWYKFTATDPTMYIEVSNPINVGLDVAVEIYEDSCGGNLIVCQNFSNANQGYENYFNNNFTVGSNYYIRVMNVLPTPAVNYPFSICVQKYPTPANDLCTNATTLTQSTSCNEVYGLFAGALTNTPAPACAPAASQDVWYQFVAYNTNLTISQYNAINVGLDAGLEIYSSDCTSSPIGCANNNGSTSGFESYTATNFTIGTTYLVRVFNASPNLSTRFFTICVQGAELNTPNSDLKQVVLSSNPVYSTLKLENMPESNTAYILYNTLGQFLKRGTVLTEIPVDDLVSGMYLLKLINDQNESVLRFIKK